MFASRGSVFDLLRRKWSWLGIPATTLTPRHFRSPRPVAIHFSIDLHKFRRIADLMIGVRKQNGQRTDLRRSGFVSKIEQAVNVGSRHGSQTVHVRFGLAEVT